MVRTLAGCARAGRRPAFAEFIWPWSVNSLAQAAVRFLAEAGPALNEFVAQTRGHLDRQRQVLRQCLRTVAGLKAYPSSASFMLIRLPEGLSAPTVWAHMAEDGILIRDCSNFEGLSDRFIRVCPKTSGQPPLQQSAGGACGAKQTHGPDVAAALTAAGKRLPQPELRIVPCWMLFPLGW